MGGTRCVASGVPRDESQAGRWRELLAPLQHPYIVIRGNHDDRACLRGAFDDQHGFPREGERNFGIDIGSVRILALDTTVPGLRLSQSSSRASAVGWHVGSEALYAAPRAYDFGTAGILVAPWITPGRRHPRTIDPYSGSARRRRKYSTRECRPSVKTRNPIGTPRKNDSARSRIAPAPSARCSCRVLDFQRWTTQFATSDADRLDCSANTGDREKTPSRREHATSSTQNPAAIAICQLFIDDLRVDAARGGIR